MIKTTQRYKMVQMLELLRLIMRFQIYRVLKKTNIINFRSSRILKELKLSFVNINLLRIINYRCLHLNINCSCLKIRVNFKLL